MENYTDSEVIPKKRHHPCVEKWDRWAWREGPVTRRYRTMQHVRGSWCGSRWLFTFRVFAMFWLTLQWWFDLYWGCTYGLYCLEL